MLPLLSCVLLSRLFKICVRRKVHELKLTVWYLMEIPINTGHLNLLQTLFTEVSHCFHLISRGLKERQKV